MFLHVPFPPLDLLETLPWASEIVHAMLAFDVVGFHTRRYVENFVRCASKLADATPTETGVCIDGREVRVGAFPLGIDAAAFHVEPSAGPDPQIEALTTVLAGRKLILGVDRLDYSKGIVERLDAFDRFLATHRDWHARVSMLQVAVPSREDVPEYAAQRRAIESRVGAINGRWGEAHWVPVRYLYRSYPREELARLFRAAHVGLITPLRDGMNLVAKEYVAAQDPEDPGVLVLSRFAGAAEELDAAVLTNPYDRTGVANALAQALEMPLAERRSRHAVLERAVARHAPAAWASDFLAELQKKAELQNKKVEVS